jgi:hypothetical protein
MAGGNFQVKLETKLLTKAIINLGNQMDKVLEVAGNNIEANAKSLIVSQDIIDTGATLNSTQMRDVPGERFQRRIGPTTEYAPYLEFGTGRGLHPAGRPFVIPALQLEEKAFIEAVAQTYKQVIERG